MDYVELTGLDEVNAILVQMSDRVGKRVCRSAAQAGATAMKKAIVAVAPLSNVDRMKVYSSTGNKGSKYDYNRRHLRNQITTKVVKSVESDVKILVSTGDAWWGIFTEKGTKRGISAKKWMQGAFDQSEPPTLDAIEAKLTSAVMANAWTV